MYTIDANVFVAATFKTEVHYTPSREFLHQIRKQRIHVLCPTLIAPECVAAIARVTGDEMLAETLAMLIDSLTGIYILPVTANLAQRASIIARTYRLRGADSVYVAVAEMYATTLITWDAEMLQRSPAIVTASTPQMWLDQQSNNGRKNGP
jgi:predicted nucleic acid-binding protein